MPQTVLSPAAFDPQDPAAFLYALSAAYLEHSENHGIETLNDEQHTLLAYCYLDSQVQEGGFVQLIAAGYGEYIFANPLADSLRRWRIKPTPKVIDRAAALYAAHGAAIETLAEAGTPLPAIRARFEMFEETDADYYDAADEDLAAAADHVRSHWDKFAALHQAV